ncbi:MULTISPECIES: hypothetical protein [Rhodopseudomonas]|nr:MULTISPECIES: hypothetical protein [Rhodopseudomonas]NEW89300.1 hypothetical protein [Rhodopseudomonas sp. WA056]QDL96094.1 hypothetical protein FLL57_01720 [Rhodopseudomonas palustris]
MSCLRKSLLIGATLLLAAPAQAQLSPNPGAVNDCTLLTDPTALRRCIEKQQGVTTYSETPPPRGDVSPLLKRERDYYRNTKTKKPKRKRPRQP